MAAYRRVYDSRHLQADCQEPGSAPLSNRVGLWATFLRHKCSYRTTPMPCSYVYIFIRRLSSRKRASKQTTRKMENKHRKKYLSNKQLNYQTSDK